MHAQIRISRIVLLIMYLIILFILLAIFIGGMPKAMASGVRFTSSYQCSDGGKSCKSSGVRIVDGFEVHKDCWEYSYTKTCNYPSKNNCAAYGHCYLVAIRECLLNDSLGNCVNQVKEYSCKRWDASTLNKDKVRYGREEKDGEEQLICKGIPCIDGNCIDKSFDSNNEMMDSVSRLYAVSEMKGAGDLNMKLFAGYHGHCSKKAADYSNCCSLTGGSNNWGQNLGARCTQDEKTLAEQRRKNLCVYVGKTNSQTLGVNVVVKHHWCCFGNMLNKVLQVEGRKQLGKTFGSASNPDCAGLTLEELLRLDFDRMDFSEFEAEIMKKMKLPNTGDMQSRIQNSMPNMQKPTEERTISDNKRDGFNANLVDDSWEADEERRIEQERLASERQRHEEERRQQLVLEQERERQRQEEEKMQRRLAKEQELAQTKLAAKNLNQTYSSMLLSLPYSASSAVGYNYSQQVLHFRQRQEDLINSLARDYEMEISEIMNHHYFKQYANSIIGLRTWLRSAKGFSSDGAQLFDQWDALEEKADRLTQELANGNY